MKKRILITRSKKDNHIIGKKIEEIGGQALYCSCIETNIRSLKRTALPEKGSWIFFTSSNGLHYFLEQEDAKACLRYCHIAVVGPQTAKAVEASGYEVNFIPSDYEANAMMEQFHLLYPKVKEVWHVQSNMALKKMEVFCNKHQIHYIPLVTYDTVEQSLSPQSVHIVGEADWLTATSPSIVRVLHQLAVEHELDLWKKPLYCIGPTTEEAARKRGFTETYYPDEYTVDGLISLLKSHL